VEAGDRHAAVPVLELADDARERIRRVRRDAAVGARMQVDRRPGRVDLDVEHPAEGGGEGWASVLVEAAVPQQHGVRVEVVRGLTEVLRKRLARHLLLALDQESKVDAELAGGGEVLDRLQS